MTKRHAVIAAVLLIVTHAHAETVLEDAGELTGASEQLKSGERYESYTLPVAPGDFFTVMASSMDFQPYIIVKTPNDRKLETRSDGADAVIQFIIRERGDIELLVTTEDPGETGEYQVAADARPLAGGLRGLTADLNERGNLDTNDNQLDTGEYADTYELSANSGDVVRVYAESSEFDAYLVVKAPDGVMRQADDCKGTNPEITFQAEETGPVSIFVTSAAAEETGAYKIRVSRATLAGGPGLAAAPDVDQPAPGATRQPAPTPITVEGALLEVSDRLSAGSATLSSGEYAEQHEIEVVAGQTVDITLRPEGFQGYLIAKTPDGEQSDAKAGGDVELSVTSAEAGTLPIIVTTTEPGQEGPYQLVATRGEGGAQPAPAINQPAPVIPDDQGGASAPKLHDKLDIVDPRHPSLRLKAAQPTAGTVQNPGVLKDTLHRMTQVGVNVQGFMDYILTSIHIPADPDDETEFKDDSGMTRGELEIYAGTTNTDGPHISWQGNTFRFALPEYEVEDTWVGETYEYQVRDTTATDLTGVVSPSGDRVEWLRIQRFERKVYVHKNDWQPAGGVKVPAGQECEQHWNATRVDLVDVPIVFFKRGSSLNNYEDAWEPTTMLGFLQHSQEDPEDISWFNFRVEGPDVRDHVAQISHLQYRNAPGHKMILDDSHTTIKFRSVDWLNTEHPPSISIVFGNL